MSTKPCKLSPYVPAFKGYARVKVGNKLELHHRLVYAEKQGLTLAEIDGIVVRHTCDVRNCIEETHLISGTQLDNIQDMLDRGRNAKGSMCKRSELTEDDIREIRKARGTCEDIGKVYGIHKQTVARILSRKIWKHVI